MVDLLNCLAAATHLRRPHPGQLMACVNACLWLPGSGPDPERPAEPLDAKAASERLLTAASIDLAAGWEDAAALRAALAKLGLSCQEVPPHAMFPVLMRWQTCDTLSS